MASSRAGQIAMDGVRAPLLALNAPPRAIPHCEVPECGLYISWTTACRSDRYTAKIVDICRRFNLAALPSTDTEWTCVVVSTSLVSPSMGDWATFTR